MSAARRLLFPAAFAALGLAVLLGLGFWQLERRVWKEELLARIAARVNAPPQAMPAEGDWKNVSAGRDEYRRVSASGVFRHPQEVLVYTVVSEERGKHAGPGYWVMTPLELPTGAHVIVNRGFVPLDRSDPARRVAGQAQGQVTVTGLLRTPEEAGWFTPENDPARGAWYRRDPHEIGRALKLDRVAPFTIDADATPNPGGLPEGGRTRLDIPNNHMQYAITWFGLAAALLGVFGVFAWQQIRGGS